MYGVYILLSSMDHTLSDTFSSVDHILPGMLLLSVGDVLPGMLMLSVDYILPDMFLSSMDHFLPYIFVKHGLHILLDMLLLSMDHIVPDVIVEYGLNLNRHCFVNCGPYFTRHDIYCKAWIVNLI